MLLLSRTRKKGIKIVSIIVLVCFICAFNITSFASQQDYLPQKIRIGIRTAAFPIGHVVTDPETDPTNGAVIPEGQFSGFCQVFGVHLQSILRENNYKIPVEFIPIENQYKQGFPRFYGLLNKDIEIECGPNSISSLDLQDSKGKKFRETIDFSKSFYETTIRLLIGKDDANRLNDLSGEKLDKKLNLLEIGAVAETTTCNQLTSNEKFYQKTHCFDAPNPGDDRRDIALTALDKESSDKDYIKAFASDGVMVKTLLKYGYGQHVKPYKDKDQGYTMFPSTQEKHLPHLNRREAYGMAIQKNPSDYSARDLKKWINKVLAKKELYTDAHKRIVDFEFGVEENELLRNSLIGLLIIAVLTLATKIIQFVLRRKGKPEEPINLIPKTEGENTEVTIPKKDPNPTTNIYHGKVIQIKDTGNFQFIDENAQGTQYNNTNISQEDINGLDELILYFQEKYPQACEEVATAIIEVEFNQIRDKKPQEWRKILNLKRVCNGIRKGSIKVGEHFAGETVWGKAVIGFIEGATDESD
jgi:polar amino acid transport system substrate-binding protein